jgi:hypothetical protein
MTRPDDASPPTSGTSLAGSRSIHLRVVTLVLAIALGTVLALRERDVRPPVGRVIVPTSGAVTVAVVGDTVMSRPIPRSERDGVVDVLRDATLAVANLEVNLLDSAGGAHSNGGTNWTFGTAREAEELAALGLDVVGHANDHATDYGQDGTRAARRRGSRASGHGRRSDRGADRRGHRRHAKGRRRRGGDLRRT